LTDFKVRPQGLIFKNKTLRLAACGGKVLKLLQSHDILKLEDSKL
jgi:hypothetical protein